MTVLVADVGGTNSRLALAGPGRDVQATARRYENDLFDSFYDVLSHYRSETGLQGLSGCCVAIAGPVTPSDARLTNRDWEFAPEQIASALGMNDAARVVLINDLVALGHALQALSPDRLSVIRGRNGHRAQNDQALIVGMGTGFNVCRIKGAPGEDPAVAEAELGHGSLPHAVFAELQSALGDGADIFTSNEALFSGRGLTRLYRVLSGGEECRGQDIIAAYQHGDHADARCTVELMARLMGLMAREMVFMYLPAGGIYYAGGAARGILGTDARASFTEAFEAPGWFDELIGQVPVSVISDDAAALIGAARRVAELGQ